MGASVAVALQDIMQMSMVENKLRKVKVVATKRLRKIMHNVCSMRVAKHITICICILN